MKFSIVGTLLSLLLCSFVDPSFGAGEYAPCGASTSVAQGSGFTIGFAWWPRSDLGAWKGLNPCREEDRETLSQHQVGVTVFRPKTDTMAVLRGARQAEMALFNSSAIASFSTSNGTAAETVQESADTDFLTLVAFQGNGEKYIRSSARKVRSFFRAVGGVNVVESLTLLVRLDKGRLTNLQWYNMGCGSCGGERSVECMEVGDGDSACSSIERHAGGLANVNTIQDFGCSTSNYGAESTCQLHIYIAFVGTDKYSVPLVSGAKIESAQGYSMTSLFSEAQDQATSATK